MQVGVLGSWDQDLPGEVYRIAEAVGRHIARHGDILFTGGSTGIMEAAMKGAKGAGGLTVGILPTSDREAYAAIGQHIDISIMTGMGEYGKLSLLINSVAGVIAIAGGAGTLIELTMAYAMNKPIVCIPVPGYTTERIRRLLRDAALDHRQIRKIHFAEDAEQASAALYRQLSAGSSEPPTAATP